MKSDSLRFLKGVGEAREKVLHSLGISTIEDILYYFPTRYYDRTSVFPISAAAQILKKGFQNEVTFIGKISQVNKIYTRRRQILELFLVESKWKLKIIYFEGVSVFEKIFKDKNIAAFSGKISANQYGEPVLVHPKFDFIKDIDNPNFYNTGVIVPYYSLKGLNQLKQHNFGSYTLRAIIHNALKQHLSGLNETLPQEFLKIHKLSDIQTTVKNLHFPETFDSLDAAKHRMKFEEIFYYQLISAQNKFNSRTKSEIITFHHVGENTRYFIDKVLPFELTEDQKKVIHEIYDDFRSGYSMSRLLQGEVGSGKTLVALITALIAFDNGFQSAIMVPTEILAFQHYQYFTKLLKDIPLNICLLTSSTPKKIKTKYLEQIESGEANIIIGTHALIEDNIQFKNLGYVVIDEQHRFGVMQRARLKVKGNNPHLLVMTATPIPRTLSLTLYSELERSTIKSLPKNRKQIKTYLIETDKRKRLYNFIRKEIQLGNQAYIIYPLIEESENIDLEDTISNYEHLKNNIFCDLTVGMIHGRLSADEKESIMNSFNRNEINILVATSVIEVGIDNPNATIIVIEEAQRFGLVQLHQLRGRVGRSNKQSYCILVANKKYFNEEASQTEILFQNDEERERSISSMRLNALIKYSDGFKIAEEDFKLRGPGDIFGTKQSGLPEFKFIDLTEDYELILQAREAAFKIINDDPTLSKKQNHILNETLTRKFSKEKYFSSIS
ncbi:MAG: ATP-dependent DNA helicase RecG [Bacteroidetes bacterium]|nr:ATP-dependent DNA helicase RecG [Bacteroidota bacterium]MBU2585406.1 ATP-dependent DNA helicase RecG [Bacteroidota bacterium]